MASNVLAPFFPTADQGVRVWTLVVRGRYVGVAERSSRPKTFMTWTKIIPVPTEIKMLEKNLIHQLGPHAHPGALWGSVIYVPLVRDFPIELLPLCRQNEKRPLCYLSLIKSGMELLLTPFLTISSLPLMTLLINFVLFENKCFFIAMFFF